MKQTAVEWLFRQLWDEPKDKFTWYAILKQAKTMEKEQTLEFTRKAVRKILDEDMTNPFNIEQYYNETYKTI
jgi:hypothetical protein